VTGPAGRHADIFATKGRPVSTALSILDATPDTALSTAEMADRERLVGVVRRFVAMSFEAAEALAQLRDRKLYRSTHPTFESFCRDVFDLGRSQAYRLIDHQRSVKVLSAAADTDGPMTIPLPTAVNQTKPLAGLPDETVVKVWKVATEDAGGGVPTEVQVKSARAKIVPEGVETEVTGPDDVRAAREAGIIPAGAEVIIEEGDPDPAPPPPPKELTDAEYLEACPARAGLTDRCRKWFDAEALAFRHCTPFRLTFSRQCKPLMNKAKREGGHVGPYMSRLSNFLRIADPTRWVACKVCDGSGMVPVIGQCGSCRGHGYHV
jgi:hypothetical protein